MSATKAEYPDKKVEVWGFDEHRVGLKPVLRRIWAKKGEPLTVKIDPHYEWSWVYGFVNPQLGETYWLILPTVNLTLFNLALEEFMKAINPHQDKIIILVIDNAGFHEEEGAIIPEGIIPAYLPPYSPELQPAEKLWPLSNEGVANKTFSNIGELEETQIQRIKILIDQKTEIMERTLFHWWPRV